MSIQRLHAFEKTSIQTRHTIKRLEMLIETTRHEEDKVLAENLLKAFKAARNMIPATYQDVDLEKE